MNEEDEPTTNDDGEQNKEETENFFSRASELRAMFEESLAMCFEPATVGVRFVASLSFLCVDKKRVWGKISKFFFKSFFSPLMCNVLTARFCVLSLSLSLFRFLEKQKQEFAQFFPTLPKDYHLPLYDLYSQLLSSIKEKSREEFEQILKEESLEIKLKAIDDACAARGIDMKMRVNSIETMAEDMVSRVVPPEEAARAARADAKRRELILLEEECEKERAVEEEHLRVLEEKRREVQMAAGRVGRAQNELEEVRDASLQWAGRQAYVSR